MNPGPLLQIIVMVLCAVAFYRGAEVEDVSGIIWGGLAICTYCFTWLVLGCGYLGNVLGQVGLLAGITIYRVLRDMGKSQ